MDQVKKKKSQNGKRIVLLAISTVSKSRGSIIYFKLFSK